MNREGLGAALFADWRYDAAGRPRGEFVLNRPEALNALSPELLDELEERLDGIERGTDTQVVIHKVMTQFTTTAS